MGMPITVFLVALMVVTYLMFHQFVEDSCTPVKNFDLKQWLFSMFPHENKEHFIYQIISFIWKGIFLEASIGSRRFASIVLKLFLITEGMIVMAVQGWLLWDAGHRYPLCHGFIWRLLFGMYGFLLPTYKSWTKLVISIFTAELAVVYCLYPVLLLSGPVCGTLSGLLCFYVPQLLINCWNRERNIVAYPTQLIEGQGRSIIDDLVWRCQSCSSLNGVFLLSCDHCEGPRQVCSQSSLIEGQGSSIIDDLVWRCQSCSSLNGVFLLTCDHCEGPRQGHSQSSLTRMMSTLELVQFTETQNFDMTDLVWNCVSCSFKNGVYLSACEMCRTLRLSDQNLM